MDLSKRITGLTGDGDDGWGIFIKARRMKAAGKPVLELTIGEHDDRTEQIILDKMHAAASGGHTGYAMVPGTDALRETVAKRIEERTGVPTSIDNILITPGGQSALFAAHSAVCDPGDAAMYIDPYYATYPGTIRGVGALPVPVQTRSSLDFQPQVDDLEAGLTPQVKSLMINSPNNPTGVVYSRETLENIAGFAKKHDLWLISDEVYDTQIWEGEHISPRALTDMKDRTLVIGSMSKSHAMTGSRCGWICAPEGVIANLITLATHTTYGVAGFIQDAAKFALEQGVDFEEKIAAPFRRRREIAKRLMKGQNAVKLIPAGGAMYLMLDIRATGLSGEDFAEGLLDQELIAVMPGESFGAASVGHIRVAMTIPDDQFEDAFARLLKYAAEK